MIGKKLFDQKSQPDAQGAGGAPAGAGCRVVVPGFIAMRPRNCTSIRAIAVCCFPRKRSSHHRRMEVARLRRATLRSAVLCIRMQRDKALPLADGPPLISHHIGDGAAPGSDSAEADGGSTPAAASAASQPPAASAPASPSSAQANSGGAVAEDSEASAPPSLEAAAAEDSADLADADAAGDDEDAAGSDEEGDEDGEWDIELTPTGLQYATTRWDGSRNMTPNRRPTREEREGYIDNEELQEEVRPPGYVRAALSRVYPRCLALRKTAS